MLPQTSRTAAKPLSGGYEGDTPIPLEARFDEILNMNVYHLRRRQFVIDLFQHAICVIAHVLDAFGHDAMSRCESNIAGASELHGTCMIIPARRSRLDALGRQLLIWASARSSGHRVMQARPNS